MGFLGLLRSLLCCKPSRRQVDAGHRVVTAAPKPKPQRVGRKERALLAKAMTIKNDIDAACRLVEMAKHLSSELPSGWQAQEDHWKELIKARVESVFEDEIVAEFDEDFQSRRYRC